MSRPLASLLYAQLHLSGDHRTASVAHVHVLHDNGLLAAAPDLLQRQHSVLASACSFIAMV